MIWNYVAFLSPSVFLARSEQLPRLASLVESFVLLCSFPNEPTFSTQIGQTPCSYSPKWDLPSPHLPTPLQLLDHI